MSYTKGIALHDEIHIDGNDVSNAFRSFGFAGEDSDVDVSGFSVTGNDESLSGTRAQSFEGEAFYTPELWAILWPLFDDRTVFEVVWRPNGLIDSSRETYYGNVQLRSFNPNATRGDVQVMTCTFKAADETGIQSTDGT
jgi:hypothetical protein